MKFPPEHLIDACIAQLNNGVDLETVLEAYPEEADELRPLLAAVAWVKMDIPTPCRRREGKQALMAAAARRRRQVEVTQGYLNELKAGIPFDEIYQHADAAMRPLIVAAWRMFSTEPPAPDAARRAAGKQQLMDMVARRREERQREMAASMSPLFHLRAGFAGLMRELRPGRVILRRALSGSAASLAILALVLLGGRGVGTAAADSLPGDAFYHVKRLGESARMAFAFDPERRAALDARFDRTRLLELSRLAREGQPLPESVLGEWVQSQRNAYAAIRRLPVAQQERLARALLDRFGDPTRAAIALGGASDGPATAWLESEAGIGPAASATETADLESDVILPLQSAPLPVQRPLPPIEESEPVELATAERPIAVEPAAAAGDEEDLLSEEAVQFIQPAPPPADDDDDDDERPASSDAPGEEEPTPEPTDDNQFVLPPMQPSPTPEP